MFDFYLWNVFDDPNEVRIDSIVDVDLDDMVVPNSSEGKLISAVDKMKVFVVRLVSQEKMKEKQEKATPKKRSVSQLVVRRKRN